MKKSLLLVIAIISVLILPGRYAWAVMGIDSIPDTEKLKAELAKEFDTLKKEVKPSEEQESQLKTIKQKLEKEIDKYGPQIQEQKKLITRASGGDPAAMQQLMQNKAKLMTLMVEVKQLENQTIKGFSDILTNDQKKTYSGYLMNRLVLEKRKIKLPADKQALFRAECDKVADEIGADKLLNENELIRNQAQQQAQLKLGEILKTFIPKPTVKTPQDNVGENPAESSADSKLKSPSQAKAAVRAAMFEEFKSLNLSAVQKQKIAVMAADEFKARTTKVSPAEIAVALEAVRGKAIASLLTDEQKNKLEEQ